MSAPLVTVIVGVRFPPDEPERKRNALATMRALNRQTLPRDQYRLILVEESDKARSSAKLTALADKTFWRKSDQPYNRGAVFNHGVEKAALDPGDVVCLMDSDLVVPEDFLSCCVEEMANNEVMIAFDEIRYLDTEESGSVCRALEDDHPSLLEFSADSSDTLKKRTRKFPGVGGAMWIRVDLYNEIGRHDEEYIGWGCEDSDLYLRLELRLQNPILRAHLQVAHLWHVNAERGETYERNLRRYRYKRKPKLNYGQTKDQEGVIFAANGARVFHFGPKAQKFGRYWTVMTRKKHTLSEPDMLAAIGKLNLQGTYVDVGAHVGNHTAFFAGCCPSTRVVAIEPDQDRMAALMETVTLNRLKGVKTLRIGAWSKRGFMVPTNTLKCTFSEISVPLAAEARTLDEVLQKDKDVILIKIDTEGSEREILLGAQDVLARCQPHLFVETIDPREKGRIGKMLHGKYRFVATYNATPTHHWAPIAS